MRYTRQPYRKDARHQRRSFHAHFPLIARIAALAASLVTLAAAPALGADGDPVNGFSTDGRQTLNLGVDEGAAAVAVQPDGKVVVAGPYALGAGDLLVARYNTDGSLDDSFSGDGWRNVSFGFADFAEAVAIAPDGKIVVARIHEPRRLRRQSEQLRNRPPDRERRGGSRLRRR